MDIVRQSLAITFVFALLWAAWWLLRRRGALRSMLPRAGGVLRGKRGLLEARGKLALSAQHSVHLVRIGDRDLALAVHPAGVTLLCELAPQGSSRLACGEEA